MRVALTLFFLFTWTWLSATAQMPDILLYQGDTLYLYANPLEPYLAAHRDRQLIDFKGCGSTACWRNYIATWELDQDSLFLRRITSCNFSNCPDAREADLQQLFGDTFRNNRVFASWVNGELINPYGPIIKYVHMGYQSIFSYERGFQVKTGLLESIQTYDNTQSWSSVLAEDTDSLHNYLFQRIQWEKLPPLDSVERKLVLIQMKSDSTGYFQEWEVIRGIHPEYDGEALRVAQTIKALEVYYRRGRPIPINWNLPIRMDKASYRKKQE